MNIAAPLTTRARRCAVAALLLAGAAAAAEIGPVSLELVRDFNTAPLKEGSWLHTFHSQGGKVYFTASTPLSGAEIFVSNGTPGSAELFGDIVPGPASSGAVVVGQAGDYLIVAGRENQRERVWSLHTGTREVQLLVDYPETYGLGPVVEARESTRTHSYFSMQHDHSLWTTDGTVAGTHKLTVLPGASNWQEMTRFCALPDGRLVLAASGNYALQSLLLLDGSANTPLELVNSSSYGGTTTFVARSTNYCYFLQPSPAGQPGWRLWRSDGSVAGTGVVVQGDGVPAGLATLADTAYLTDRSADQQRLWRAGEAQPLASWPAPFAVDSRLRAIGGKLVLIAPTAQASVNDRTYRVVLSDGTAAGTRSVFPVQAGQVLRWEPELVSIGANLVFSADFKNYRLDTATGTIAGFGDTSTISGFQFREGLPAVLGDIAVGVGYDEYGAELWRSDGTAAGSYRIADIRQSTAHGVGYTGIQQPAIGNVLYFSHVAATPAAGGDASTLWRTDGTAAGTWGLPRSAYDGLQAQQILRAGDGLLFRTSADSPPYGAVYRVDAALSAATPLWNDSTYSEMLALGSSGAVFGCDLAGAPDSLCAYRDGDPAASLIWPGFNGYYRMIGSIGNVVLFFGDTENREPARGLWRSDGTAPGTFRVAGVSVYPGAYSPPVPELGGRLVFGACVSGQPQDCGLYASDGTTAGTARIAPYPPAASDVLRLGSRLILANSAEVYSSDGTAAGTAVLFPAASGDVVHGLAAAGGYAHFVVVGWTSTRYFVTDGTPAGTRTVALPPGLTPYSLLGALDEERVLFICMSAAIGHEPCVITADGSDVRLLRDLFPGPGSSLPGYLGRTTDAAYLAADDGRHGRELWRVARVGDALFAAGFE
ncbi:hypothetical protein [Tahibacter harae]|uniref:ELWxxDGT repeat protein n=1 Tax=Tahibacter harae TaxID=2963937 RepID=A0ABT1QPI9_9GAMM|nr:hypothetical protein [Tahibacter harae]MCQ4164198.1 hypothetical protein [Tahibacter harae]